MKFTHKFLIGLVVLLLSLAAYADGGGTGENTRAAELEELIGGLKPEIRKNLFPNTRMRVLTYIHRNIDDLEQDEKVKFLNSNVINRHVLALAKINVPEIYELGRDVMAPVTVANGEELKVKFDLARSKGIRSLDPEEFVWISLLITEVTFYEKFPSVIDKITFTGILNIRE